MANKNAVPPEHGKIKPGEIRNPKGRPKKLPEIDALLAEVLGQNPDDPEAQSEAKAVLLALVKKAKSGSVPAQIAVLDRAYGKPKQALEHTGPDGDALHTGGITLVFNTPNIEPVTSEAAMAEIFEKFKDV